MATPTEIRVKRAEKALVVTFDDGLSYTLPAEYLRVESPSAEVQGHAPDQKVLVWGRRHVGIMSVEPVGNYAIRIVFDDLHDTGIYAWDYLRTLGAEHETRWARYLEDLAARNLSREPRKAPPGRNG
ncbi:DUF971 domain-containing protein [Elioraea sp.]|uniref:DUF971 domain-containing protein n=1 Tax=Elioraea sp. TaxID=2185103 RepID=UPI0025C137CB|nr:DUF971 domain-containing protein [Elioraea sp.]